jgi:hypothetical protein
LILGCAYNVYDPLSLYLHVRPVGLFLHVRPNGLYVYDTAKQKIFYALFDKVLITDKGKLLVRQYASTFDAQKVFCDLTVYANTSTMAAQEAADLLTYNTSSKFGDGMWKGK